jgi:hypothetical protein
LSRINNDIAAEHAKQTEEERKQREAEEKRKAGNTETEEVVEVEIGSESVTVGGACGDNDSGVWTIDDSATQKCTDSAGDHKCKCVATSGGGAGSVSSTSTGNSSSSGGGQVVNPVKSANGGKKDGKKSKEQCVKTHGEYLSAGCVCESGTGLIPVLDDMSGKRYCGCGTSDTWNGTNCSNTAFKPKGNYTVSYGGETWTGIGACSSVPGGNAGNVVNEQSKVQRAYDNYTVTDDKGENCYCKIIDPKKSSWVFSYRFDNLAECVKMCVVRCRGHISIHPEFQKNVFDTIM